jgi:DNA (cytosine-5)-methyltransferase 1
MDGRKMSFERPRTISLYSGAGGLDYGFEAAGFETAVALEIDPDCCRTIARSRSWSIIRSDIGDVSTGEILRTAAAHRGDNDLVLLGGPPCQPFSKSGWWSNGDSRRLMDPRASTLDAYLRVLEEALPAAFLLENVEGLAYKGKNEGLKLLLSRIEAINGRHGTSYDPVVLRVNAADYGVPQLRTRVILIGLRGGDRFQMPPATHGEGLGLEPYHTAWDAIGGLAPGNEDVRARGKWAELLPSIPEGHNYLYHTDRMDGLPLFGWRRRYWSFLLKLAKDKPSWTIQAQPGPATGPFHWDNRLLTIRELCRLQTFPDDVEVTGNRSSAVRQLGNAVPSLLGEVIARAMLEQLLGVKVSTPPRLMPRRQTPVPAAEDPQPIPDKYLRLAGTHPAHPGTGMGYRSSRMREKDSDVPPRGLT